MKTGANDFEYVVAFDTECTYNNVHVLVDMAEFAYTKAGPRLNIIEESGFIVKAEIDENLECCKFKEEDVRYNPEYPFYYEKVKTLFEEKNTVFLSHNPEQDIKYLAYKHMFFDLPLLKMSVYDTQKIVDSWGKINARSVKKICRKMKIKHRAHEAFSDARALIMIMKRISRKENMTFSEILEKYGKNAMVDSDAIYEKYEKEFEEYSEVLKARKHQAEEISRIGE